jgi:hypothetical protein
MEKDPATSALIALHGGAAKLRLDILTDYFKSGFNGDGDDGGSCIDGACMWGGLSLHLLCFLTRPIARRSSLQAA